MALVSTRSHAGETTCVHNLVCGKGLQCSSRYSAQKDLRKPIKIAVWNAFQSICKAEEAPGRRLASDNPMGNQLCGKCFSPGSSLRRHRGTQHQEENQEGPQWAPTRGEKHAVFSHCMNVGGAINIALAFKVTSSHSVML